MENAGFLDRLGRENVCPHITAALARAREILGLPPVAESPEPQESLHAEKKELEAARQELSAAVDRAHRMLNKPRSSAKTPLEK
jgi:SulP family sulfate permease